MRVLLLIIALGMLSALPSWGADILILQASRNPAYSEVLQGFQSNSQTSARTVVLSDYTEVDVVRLVKEERPRLVLAVGDSALTAAGRVRNTPVVAVMTLGIHNINAAQPNLTGISMFIPPERYVALFQSMKIQHIGVVYNDSRSEWYLRQALTAARQAGIELVVRKVSTPQAVLERLDSMTGKVDAIWMLPDTTAVTRETSEAFFRFGQENAVPVIAFSASYLGLGAAAAYDIDRAALGRQAAAMVASILSGATVTGTPFNYPRSVVLKSNPKVLKQLKLQVGISAQPAADH
jgi:putative ABC transport system substrate-binding protein